MKTINFNHEAKNINEAFGIKDDRKSEIEALVFYHIIDTMTLAKSLFDDVDDAPSNIRSKSGWIEKIIDDMNTDEERMYAMWETSKIDHVTDHDDKGKAFLAAMSMVYKVHDGDKDKFVKFFVNMKNEAKKFLNKNPR